MSRVRPLLLGAAVLGLLGLTFAPAALAQTLESQPTVASRSLEAPKAGSAGLRLGLGTDISGGVAVGGQIGYTLNRANNNAFELGLVVFGGNFEETSDNGFNTYEETTKVFVIGAIGNYLFRHAMGSGGPYFVLGGGVGAVSVEWEESSTTDTSLGTPLPGGGSMQSDEGTVGGVILNFGIGHRFNKSFDLRAQVPTFFISGTDVRDGATIPTLTLTAGLLFN